MDEIARLAAFLWGVSSSQGVFLGLEDGYPIESVPLEPYILIKATSVWEGIRLQSGQAFVIVLPFIGGTQEADMTGLIDHEEVFVGRAMDWTFGTIMPKRGDVGVSFVCVVARRTVNSSAVRVGSMPW